MDILYYDWRMGNCSTDRAWRGVWDDIIMDHPEYRLTRVGTIEEVEACVQQRVYRLLLAHPDMYDTQRLITIAQAHADLPLLIVGMDIENDSLLHDPTHPNEQW